MNIIVKCPSCGKAILATPNKGGPTSEVITTDMKVCSGCNKTLKISIRILVEVQAPEGAKA
jgi:predicted RNA-binding Zn-ribbon protein involved in translation (DUF1610 family)